LVKRTAPPLYPDYPKEELEWRADRARKIMREQGLDALMLAQNLHVYYATGMQSVSVCRPDNPYPQPTVIITMDDLVLARRAQPETDSIGKDTTWVENLEYISDEPDLVNVLRKYGIRKGYRVGTEMGPGLRNGITRFNLNLISQRLWDECSAQLVDGSIAIWKLRAVKSKLEVDRMRKSVEATAKAMDRCLDVAEVGMNQLDLARKAAIFMLEEGATMVDNMQVYDPPFGGAMALDRRIESGYIGLDLSAIYRFYISDLYRLALLERQPTEEERQLYDCRAGVNAVLQKAIKPGVSTDEVVAEMTKYVKECGCTVGEGAGHGIGLEAHESPGLYAVTAQPEFQNADGKVIIEEGMIFALEPNVRHPKLRWGFNCEDNVVVTDTGCEVLSTAVSRDLRIKP
jgi:Xaa-Pro aminopeptidase